MRRLHALASGAARPALALALALGGVSASVAACGYHPVYGGASGATRLHVALARTLVPDAAASDEVVSGLREELAREGALASGDGFPRVEVEVLRADAASEAIASAGSSGPRARALAVGIVARAWMVASPGASSERDTGDVRSEDVIAVDESAVSPGVTALDPRAEGFHEADALRAAARRLGSKLGRRILGNPAASENER